MSHSITLAYNKITAGSSGNNTVANKGKFITDNRQQFTCQMKSTGTDYCKTMKPGINPGSGKVFQLITPGDEFANENEEREENPNTALIGTDMFLDGNIAVSPLKQRLEDAKTLGVPLPAYLSRHIRKRGEPYGQLQEGENDAWMDQMTQEQRVFILKHERIKNAMDQEFTENKLIEARGGKGMTGTWAEVQKLIRAGYLWDNQGLLYPEGTSDEKLQAAKVEEARIAELEAVRKVVRAKPPGGKGGGPKKDKGGGRNKGGFGNGNGRKSWVKN